MDNKTLALECFKLATVLVSPSVHNRTEEVANTGKRLYSAIIDISVDHSDSGNKQNEDTQKVVVRRGRPPKPLAG